MMQKMQPDQNKLTDDPLMYTLLVDQFEAVYARLLEESRVHLSDQVRISVRRTIIRALEPRIREVKEEGAMVRGMRVKGFDDFRNYISAEMRRMIEQFHAAGILDELADIEDTASPSEQEGRMRDNRTKNVNRRDLAA